jgi:hypothetical protein
MPAKPPPAGYSGTPLPRKLGIKEGHRVGLVQAPPGFTLDELPNHVTLHRGLRGTKPYDVLVFFTRSRTELSRKFPVLASRLAQNGGLWISWPKKASGVATDVSESDVREIGLGSGLVDNKICAVDATWSGLRFVIRLQNRRQVRVFRP